MVVVVSIVETWMDLMNVIVKMDWCCQVTTQRALVINWHRVSIILIYKINLNVLMWYKEPCLNRTSLTPIFVFRINRYSVKLTKILYKKNFFIVWFIHDSCIFRVLFRQVSLYIWWKVDTIMFDGLIETLLEATHWNLWVLFLDMKCYVSIIFVAHRVIWIIVNTWRPSL